MINNFATV